jgi:hypothetical protein
MKATPPQASLTSRASIALLVFFLHAPLIAQCVVPALQAGDPVQPADLPEPGEVSPRNAH